MRVNRQCLLLKHAGTFFAYNTLTCQLSRLTPQAVIALGCVTNTASNEQAFEMFRRRFSSATESKVQRNWQALLEQLNARNFIWDDPDAPAPAVQAQPEASPLSLEKEEDRPAPFQRAFQVLGLCGRVSSNNAEFIRAFHAEHQGYALDEGGKETAFRIHCAVEPCASFHIPEKATLVDKQSNFEHFQGGGLHFFNAPDAGVIWKVDYASGLFMGSAAQAYPLLEQARIFFEIAVSRTVENRWIPCHGSVISRNGKGILLLGDSRQGKSTLAWALCQDHGFSLVADDTFFFNPETGQVAGYLPHIALSPDNPNNIPLPPETHYHYTCGASRYLIPARQFPFPVEETCTAAVFIVLLRVNQAASHLMPVETEPENLLIPRLMSRPKHFWHPKERDRAEIQRQLGALLSLSQQARAFGLYLGTDLPAACQTMIAVTGERDPGSAFEGLGSTGTSLAPKPVG